MSAKKIGVLFFRIAAALIVLALVFFILGFAFGYFFWFPRWYESRLRQAIDWGLSSLLLSVILDPVLIVKVVAGLAREKEDSDCA